MRSSAIFWALAALFEHCLSDDTPQALVIPASQYFEGIDGPWSTFDIRVGTPRAGTAEQYLRVLVSTASPETMVVVSDGGCSTSVFATVPADCAVSRGNLFNLSSSSTWHDMGIYGINQNGIGLEANLGYSERAQFGLDTLGIGLQGPSLGNQTVAGIATTEPFYLGIFGLNNQPVNYTQLGNYSAPSFLTTLKDQNKIPSLSWSYTAGARYRLKTVYGQLIFSGYDTSRFTENSVSFTMAEDITRDLVVALQSISYSGSTSATILSNPIDIYIDSTDPNLWLPDEACDAFEKAFGLTLDSATGLYLVNATHNSELLASNAQVTFRLSDVKEGGAAVTIVLPYDAFNLTAEYPLVANSSSYFPLKRANSSAQYTLGRTFLQEAYLSVDYERKVFNVSACTWDEGAKPNIVTITSKDAAADPGTSGSPSSSATPSDAKKGLGGGAIAGIVIGVVGAILLAIGLAFCLLRKRRKWMKQGFAKTTVTPEPDESVLKGPVFNSGTQSSATATHSSPFSGADMSVPARSTAEYSRSGADTPARTATNEGSAAGGSTVELDGRDTLVRPNTELDGREIQPVAENPGVYELPGTEVAGDQGRETERDSTPSRAGSSPSNDSRDGGNSPPGTYVSTLGTTWERDDEQRGNHELVSPIMPRHGRGPRAF
ncbi:acid protease [Coniochaeta ligniaria NRRL 30616]|uniref:Acid protease n=1 Tax=Coniochaeta ligniaria NRRL 30616 TaxID=1408157 RepID=A0A1J7IBZ6_9PEZI|nr:acid protease [Coniochaeta ligniaria NRRL 30616]